MDDLIERGSKLSNRLTNRRDSFLVKEMLHRIESLTARLKEADWLIQELNGHEGAEGWSDYLHKRLEAYRTETSE